MYRIIASIILIVICLALYALTRDTDNEQTSEQAAPAEAPAQRSESKNFNF